MTLDPSASHTPRTRCLRTVRSADFVYALVLGFVLFWCGIGVEPGLAQVPRIQGQGTAASGMSNAFSAQADDPSALHYNPAGMTQLHGVEFMTGILLSGGTTSFTSPTGQTATGDRNGSVAWPPPGHMYLTANLKDLGVTALGDLTVGIGLTVPFGSITRWPNDGPFRTVTTFNTLPLLDIKPTVAYRVTKDLSLGLGADIYTFSGLFGEGQVERKFVWPGGSGIPAGSQMELFGSDTAAGFNVSLLYTALRNADDKPVANIGIVYRSQATLHLNGGLLANGAKVSDATATFVLPQVITGAVAIWPVRNREREWKLDVDVANGSTIPQPLNWRSTYAVMVGTEYKWLALESLPGWELALRTGWTNQQNQMPDVTFDPGIPSADVNILGGGAGFLCKEQGRFLGLIPCGELGIGEVKPKSIGLDLSFQAALYEDRTITGNRNPTVNGLYKTTYYVGGISFKIAF